MTRPNFLVIGAMRAGTTSLFEYIRHHPQIFVPAAKELSFFGEHWDRGMAWYEAHFDGAGDALAIGEASPQYTMYPNRRGIAERIAKSLPDVRLIYLLRDPIERARSDYVWRLAEGMEHRPIAQALLSDPTYVWMSSYAMQIHEYLRFFDRSRILLVVTEDMRDRREETLRHVFEFLGIDAAWKPPNLETNYNEPRPTKPRASFRKLGSVIIRARVAMGWEFTPRQLPARYRRWISEPVSRSETLIPDGIRGALADAFRADLLQLRELMPPGFEAWGLL